MGYFSNGTEGDMYEAKYCANCVHGESDPEKPVCPVMLAHLFYAYEECNSKSNAKHILDTLIPIDGAFNAQCSMFVPADALARKPKRRKR